MSAGSAAVSSPGSLGPAVLLSLLYGVKYELELNFNRCPRAILNTDPRDMPRLAWSWTIEGRQNDTSTTEEIPMGGSEKFRFYWRTKKISSRGPLSWRNSMFVSCVFKRRWRLGGRKCRKMPESDICVYRKAKVVELHIVCMLKQS